MKPSSFPVYPRSNATKSFSDPRQPQPDSLPSMNNARTSRYRSRKLWFPLCTFALLLSAACGSINDQGTRQAPAEVSSEAAQPVIKRLSKAQYTNSIHALFGNNTAVPIFLEPDVASEGFVAVGASLSSISPLGVERYESAAFDIAKQVLASPAARQRNVPCEPTGKSDASCAEEFLRFWGLRIFRRPLSEAELKRYGTIAEQASGKLEDFYQGLEFALAGLLQSPHFLFRIEIGSGDPDQPGQRRYTGYEMATRLAYVIWNTTPDDTLLAAAAAGELENKAGLETHVDRLLADKRARRGLRNFFAERFSFQELDDLVKDTSVFTSMSAELGSDAREETLSLIEHIAFDARADYRDLFTTRTTFLNRKLASLYEVAAPSLDGFGQAELPQDGARAGLLGHASILAQFAHSTSTSATLRGKFIRYALLCSHVAPPPADVDTSLPEPSQVMPTLRDRIKEHLTNPSCASCHNFLDPIGLGLEQFDGIGKFRSTENDVLIDASGELDGQTFAGPVELGQALRNHPAIGRCMARHLYRYSSGTLESDGEEALIAYLAERFSFDEFRIVPLWRNILLSDGFRYAQIDSEEAQP